MKYLNSATIGVTNGSQVLFSDFSNDGPMWTGTGPREMRQAVSFPEAFTADPTVTVSISMWDVAQETALRADICAENISRWGFDLVFRTWSDTRVARVRADWMAIGPVMSEDDWDVDG
ncbi:H-type lectin domain-containing protein [Falsirhodobacter algicola]|uniref:H-type lectin domain-containing protein n=1 Tax=Falsirhodobacter algicola TaxID=2692330 RepID=A0A8J8MSN8_9RHOB|nr:H-type lectin domain-containing protein [Falsirhodobacter algicola]QUS35769.1 hypothetical protein GR316_05555 [Falsirhodobacter algicola]